MNRKLYIYLTWALLSAIPLFAKANETIPFRLEGNLLLIKATLNGQTGNFLLDTGAPELILNRAYFEGMRIPWDEKEVIDFNGHASEARHFAISDFSIGGLSIKKQYALTVDLSSIEIAKGIHLLGIIGYAVLKDLELLFDFDRQELSLAPAQKKRFSFDIPEMPAATFDLRFSGHLPYLIAHIGKKKLRFGLDTGAEVNILDNKSFRHAEDHFDAVKKLQVKGITHHQQAATSGTLQNLSINGQRVGPLQVTVINIGFLNESLTIGLDGILGMPFLKRGRVGLDYGERKMMFWPSDGRLVREDIDNRLEVNIEK
jgi:predicted aspartyl protease